MQAYETCQKFIVGMSNMPKGIIILLLRFIIIRVFYKT